MLSSRLCSRTATRSVAFSHSLDGSRQQWIAIAVLGLALLRFAAPAAAAAGTSVLHPTTLTASDGEPMGVFGESVATDGKTVLVGSPGATIAGQSFRGAAYVFERHGKGWIEQARLTAPDGDLFDGFGYSVAVSGDTALVGAPQHAVGGQREQGAVYVFVRTGATWTLQSELTATDGTSTRMLGHSVALDGDTALVGAPEVTTPDIDSGAAYVFVRSGTTWHQEAKLALPDGRFADFFGDSVALSHDTAVITTVSRGVGYVFVRSGTVWSPETTLRVAGADIGGPSIDGNTVLLGGLVTTTGGQRVSGAYIFVRDGTTWGRQATIAVDDAEAGCLLGSGGLSGDFALLRTAYCRPPAQVRDVGYIFERRGTAWRQHATLKGDAQVSSATLKRGVAVVGVPFAPDGSPAQGSIDVFGFPENFVVTGADAGGAPQVDLFDTGTGSRAVGLFAYTPLFPGGARVAIADVTGDGVPDVVTGAGPGGGPHVRVFDGVTGAQVSGVNGSFYAYAPEFRGGVYVAAGDLDGDGRADIVTGAGSGGGPHVRVFSGATGAQLPPPIGSFFAYAAAFSGGVRVAVGDVDGDGVPDIITAPGPGMTATVRVFSGTTARLVREFTAFDPGFRGGAFVAAGDVDGDGRADIVAGADAGGGPHVRVFSGATGLQLPGVIGSFFAYSPAFAGGVRVAAADINGDGRADIITGAGPGGGPHVRVFDGASGAELPTPLGSFFAYAPTFSGGVFVAGPPFGVLARMVIDLPSSRATLRQPFVVAGWALDAASPVDTGIDTIHVWAYPISSPSQAPIFLGVAEYGLARPDVAAIFGTRDTRVGYTLTANGLAAGSYTIVVYAHSSRTHTFASARTVTITVQ